MLVARLDIVSPSMLEVIVLVTYGVSYVIQ
jgi:hypothetical protein